VSEARPAAPSRSAIPTTLILALGVAVALRAAASRSAGMWAWGLNDARFLPPALGASFALACALALVPAIARPISLAIERIANHLGARGALLAGAIATGGLVALFPDETQFTGDFALRRSALEGHGSPAGLFPQALPLDLFTHITLPRWLAHASGMSAGSAERWLGVLKAALLGALAVQLARVLRVRGAAALGVAAVLAVGGYVGMLTGCGQSFGDLCLLTAAAGVFGLMALDDARALAPFALAAAGALFMHREGIALLPAWAAVSWLTIARARAAGRNIPNASWIWLAVPALAFGLIGPRIVRLALGFDRAHLSAGSSNAFGWLLDAQRLGDLANLLVRLSPLALLVPLLLAVLGVRVRRRPEAVFVMALVVPWLLGMLLVHPEDQGLVRDWGTFAAAGVAFSFLGAWLLSRALEEAPGATWLGVAVAIGCVAPVVEQLWQFHDSAIGMRRVEAYVEGPPQRPDAHRATTLDYLGNRYHALGRDDLAAASYRRAAEITPSRRILYDWALCEAAGGRYAAARDILNRLIDGGGATAEAEYTLGVVNYMLGDMPQARRAALAAIELSHGAPDARALLARIDSASPAPAPLPASGAHRH
jgi:tetratricopeptide (TPR) repeat protein